MIPDSFYMWLIRVEYVVIGIIICKVIRVLWDEIKLQKERRNDDVP